MSPCSGKVSLLPGETVDDLQRGGLKIIQGGGVFKFGIDAVLLSGFVTVREGDRVLDLGTGTGILPILLSEKTSASHLTGLEKNPLSVSMASRSVEMNALSGRVSILEGDIKDADRIFPSASFDVVVSNPPYIAGGGGRVNSDPSSSAARHEIWCTFDDVAKAAAHVTGSGGRFCLVHRPHRLAEIIRTLSGHRFETKRLQLVYPYLDREPTMVLLEAVKGARPEVKVERPLIIYESPGVYTRPVRQIYGEEI